MSRSIDEKFYRSTAWHKARAAYIENVNGLCERCKANGLIVAGKIVHHKIHLNKENYLNPEITLSFENMELLCTQCHNIEHFKDVKQPQTFAKQKKRRYIFDKNGKMLIE